MSELTLPQQLSIALKHLSEQHEQQLAGLLQQVQTLSQQVATIQSQRSKDGLKSDYSSNENPHLAHLIPLGSLKYPEAACLGCKKAMWYEDYPDKGKHAKGDFVENPIKFLCLNSGFNAPVRSCSTFEKL